MGIFGKIFGGLKKTATAISGGISAVFSKNLDEEFYEELEMILLSADMGAMAVEEILDDIRRVAKSKASRPRKK